MNHASTCLIAALCLAACDDGGAASINDATPSDAAIITDQGAAPDAALDAATLHDAQALDASLSDAAGFELPPPDQVGGAARPAVLMSPADYDGARPLPLFVLLGGYWNLASDLDGWLGASAYVDDYDFLLAFPDGLIDSDGAPYWNATDTCCDFDGRGDDDVAYLSDLIDEVRRRVNVDSSRVVLLGHSNGGFMGYRLACDIPDRISALVSMAGSGWLDAARCGNDATPVSVLQVHGTDDETMPIAGDDSAPSALTMMNRWAARNGCAPDSWAESAERLELVDDGLDDETTQFAFTGCQAGSDVRLWQLDGNDHYPEFSWTYTETVLEWGLDHPRR